MLEKMVLEGAYITPGMNLYKIADLSRVWIMADIYEYEVPLVKVGQTGAGDPAVLIPDEMLHADGKLYQSGPGSGDAGPSRCGLP